MPWFVGVIATVLVVGGMTTVSAQTPTPAVPPHPVTTDADLVGTTRSHWTASGFVGANLKGSADDASVDFGGVINYLWRGVIGPEVLADFAPSFKMNNVLLAQNPSVNSYMVNVVAALPLGAEGQYQPYFSAGLGGVHLMTDVFTIGPSLTPPIAGASPTLSTASGNQLRLGADYGGGMMAFVGAVGVRADLRYYKATTDNNINATTPVEQFTQQLLSGLTYWRANIGVVFRW